ncbi:MAG: NAD-dependent succinate-semialdehyde dehydrogenase [Chitinophagales bacterium]|nr:NAD-dependent succinate-semialdehyde dehydrogenase [Chitinophagales bacterium]
MFTSLNPYNNEFLASYDAISSIQMHHKVDASDKAFRAWKLTSLAERLSLLKRLADVLIKHQEPYALMITQEMGKPIHESRAEIAKCAWVCEYYAAHSEEFLADKCIATDASKSYVRIEPIGSILAIMPWNFPFWQVFRFAVPSLSVGNTALLKHAPNVMGCAFLIEDVFLKAGYPVGVFQTLAVSHEQTEELLAREEIRAVSLTGSERAGIAIAQIAGKNLKKCVLELGGNNAFIVLHDADLELTIRTAVKARMMNAGQSCIAAKRFIVVEAIYDEFILGFKNALKQLKYGDPMDESTDYGPLARRDLAEQLQDQLKKSIAKGALLELGGKQVEAMHELTLITGVKPGMPAFDEETFGPLVAVIRAKDEHEAIELASRTKFGLGLSIFSKDIKRAEALVPLFEDGAVFINDLVKSDPRLPFGGTKLSGYGRELSKEGILEFVNKKTVYIK